MNVIIAILIAIVVINLTKLSIDQDIKKIRKHEKLTTHGRKLHPGKGRRF
jgi:hypothetical protein